MGKIPQSKPTLLVKLRDFTSSKKQINLSSSTHSSFFSYIIHVNVLVQGKKKKSLKHSVCLPGSSYYKFCCVSSSINVCFLFLLPFPLIPSSDLSWPELFCWFLRGHLGGCTPRCFILQSWALGSPCRPQHPANSFWQDGLPREYGKTGIAAAFPRDSKLSAI